MIEEYLTIFQGAPGRQGRIGEPGLKGGPGMPGERGDVGRQGDAGRAVRIAHDSSEFLFSQTS